MRHGRFALSVVGLSVALTVGASLPAVAQGPAGAGGQTTGMAPASGPGAAAAVHNRPPPVLAWAPKKSPYLGYEAPNRPWWKLSDVLAMHRGEQTWSQPIVRNKDLAADWKQLAPGGRTTPMMYPDNRVGMIVWGGQVRVSIEGQEPFVASKGFEVDIPFRIPFTLETVGAEPALWLEVHQADDEPLYPIQTTPEKPADPPGWKYMKVIVAGGQGTWDEHNKPYLDYYKDVVQGGARAGAFIASDHMFINNIRGKGTPTPPPSDLGHFHIDYSEFWFDMEGNISYQIEGVPFFTASPGDVVTAAQGRWHRASFGGPVGQMDTRVAINPFPRGLHDYTPESGGHQ
jgi:mannose-6-phosphate isomerase-like protein (cupin superfamily)